MSTCNKCNGTGRIIDWDIDALWVSSGGDLFIGNPTVPHESLLIGHFDRVDVGLLGKVQRIFRQGQEKNAP